MARGSTPTHTKRNNPDISYIHLRILGLDTVHQHYTHQDFFNRSKLLWVHEGHKEFSSLCFASLAMWFFCPINLLHKCESILDYHKMSTVLGCWQLLILYFFDKETIIDLIYDISNCQNQVQWVKLPLLFSPFLHEGTREFQITRLSLQHLLPR